MPRGRRNTARAPATLVSEIQPGLDKIRPRDSCEASSHDRDAWAVFRLTYEQSRMRPGVLTDRVGVARFVC
jgi:hypothetical protein